MKKILVALIILGLLGGGYFWFFPCKKSGLFKVESGQTLSEISRNLEKQGFLSSPIPFRIYVLAKFKGKDLKAGVYSIDQEDTISSLVQKFISGKSEKIKVTIPEGFTLSQIQHRINQKSGLNMSNLKDLTMGDFKQDFPVLESVPSSYSLEGFLFPDTYYFYPNQSKKEVIKEFLENFSQKISSLEERKDQDQSLAQIITLASILEKEVDNFKHRRIISGILQKRLDSGWFLQIDAPLTYITGKGSKELTKKDLALDSPYNTYKYKGLPPGPICNPGQSSIQAALSPQDSEFWYYLSTSQGKTIFSKTLKEHNRAVYQYLR